MKKVILAGTLSVFLLGVVSCGGGHKCDAYRKSDYTKYKSEKTVNKIQLKK